MIEIAETTSPLGPLRFALRDGGLAALSFADGWSTVSRTLADDDQRPANGGRAAKAVTDALARYFDGDIGALDELTTNASGTRFRQKAWAAMRAIPPGRTASYGALAAEIGAPGAARAVGSAARTNPIGIVVPCHRVVRTDGTLGGYAGGLVRKQWLLEHERGTGRLPECPPTTPRSSTPAG
jgi:methylated-DNA-[protein]-cysteine S-methyltransferase